MTGYPQDHLSSSSSPAKSGEPLVVLEFSSFEDFLQSCASKICTEGLFLEVEPRERVHSPLRFELRIRDGFRLLRGEGEVIEVHDPLPYSGEVAGVTVRFISLDEASQKLLPVVLDHYHQKDIPLLDLEADASAVEVQVTARELADPASTEVTLDDLWEEFEVVADRQSVAPEDDEGPAGLAREALLVEAEQFANETDAAESGEELEAAPAVLDEVESGIEAPAVDELEAETAVAVEGEAGIEDQEALDDEALDLAGVLPTAPGAITSSEDLELLPDETAEPEEVYSKPWWQRRQIWLFLFMAFLGILIGFVVYLKYLDDFEWPWTSAAGSAQSTSSEVVASELAEGPDNRDIIASYDFEDPAQVVARLGEPEPDEAAAERQTPPRASRKDSVPKPIPTQARAQKKPPARPPSEDALTGVDRITWQESQGQTVLTLWGDGPFDADQLVVYRLDTGTPRQVVKILGVSRPFSERNLAVGTSHVTTVRTGLHTGDAGQELHVVADLEDPEVRMRRLEPEGSQLHVYFSKL